MKDSQAVRLLHATKRILEATEIPILIQEILEAAHETLGFERVRFYLVLREQDLIQQQGIEGGPDDGETDFALAANNSLGCMVLEERQCAVLRVSSLGNVVASEDALQRCIVTLPLPDAGLGVVVADNPRTRRDAEEHVIQALQSLVEFPAFAVEHLDMEERRIRFVASVSHELRTPLTSITAFTEMLTDGDAGELTERQNQFVQRIWKGSSQLERIVEDLLELTQLYSDTEPNGKTAIAIKPFLEDMAQNFLPQASAKNIGLSVEAANGLPILRTDERRLQQAIANFVANAIKYSPTDTNVRIRATADDKDIVISVIDEGFGISPADQRRIFEEFYRCYRDRESLENKGSGLGLSIVTCLAKMLGAKIDVESSVGEGSTFSLIFPLSS